MKGKSLMNILKERQKNAEKSAPAKKKTRKRKKTGSSGQKGEIMQYLTRTDSKEVSNKEEYSEVGQNLNNIDMSEDNPGVKTTFLEPHNIPYE